MRFIRLTTLGIAVSAVLGTANASAPAKVILQDAQVAGPLNPEAEGVICSGGGCQTIQDFPVVPAAFGTMPVSAVAPFGDTEIGASADISATINYTPDPDGLRSVSVTGTLSAVPFNGAVAFFNPTPSLSYNLEILGQTDTVMAQFLPSGGVSLSGGGLGLVNNVMSATLQVINPMGGGVVRDQARTGLGPSIPTFSESGTYTLDIGELYTVNLALNVAGEVSGNLGGGTETYSAFVDPKVVLPDGYSIVLSPAPAGAVPEASTWAMILFGFAALGVIHQRHARCPRSLAVTPNRRSGSKP
jgi:hypothetical protein